MLTAVILAAGAGTRLGDAGSGHSKATVRVAARPLIRWVVDLLHAADVERLIIVAHPSDTELAALVGQLPDATLVLQAARRGIADALAQAQDALLDEPAYLACACDSLYPADELRRLIDSGRQTPNAAVVGVLDMGIDATSSRSAVRLAGDRILELVEKPPPGTAVSSLVALPLYWLPRRFATYCGHTAPENREGYVTSALNDFVGDGGEVRALRMSRRLEVTTPSDLEHADHELLEPWRWIFR